MRKYGGYFRAYTYSLACIVYSVIYSKDIGYKSNLKYWFKCPRGIHESELHKICVVTTNNTQKLLCKKCHSLAQMVMDKFGENYSSYASYPIAIWDMKYLGIRDFLLTNGEGAPKYIEGSSRIEHVSSNPDKIKWILVDDAHSGDIIADPKLIEPQGISLPKEIVLTKVE